ARTRLGTSAPPTTTMLVMARIATTVTRRRQNAARCGASSKATESASRPAPSVEASNSTGLTVPIACNRRERVQASRSVCGNDVPAVVGDNDIGPCPLLDAREKTIINDESSDGDATKALVDRPDRLGTQGGRPAPL